MGKQVKKKDEKLKGEKQKRHNKATRGINTTKKPVVWDRRIGKFEDENGEVFYEEYEVTIPPYLGYDPFDYGREKTNTPPFDSFKLDWRLEIQHYVSELNADPEQLYPVKTGSIKLKNGEYLHRVYEGNNLHQPDYVHFEVQSAKSLTGRK